MVFTFIVLCVVLRDAEYVNAQWYPLQFRFGTNTDHNKGIVLQLIINSKVSPLQARLWPRGWVEV